MNSVAYVDNIPYERIEGETILSFLERHFGSGIVPTLCHISSLEPFGSCQICSVEASKSFDGPKSVVAACHMPLNEGAHIFPETELIQRLRRNILELVLTDHPVDCLNGDSDSPSELREVAARVGIKEIRYPEGRTHFDRAKDESHPYLRTDMSQCINCYRCVRACDEIQGEFVLSMQGRGFDSRIIKGLDEDFAHSGCVSCGRCVTACPTDAISDVFNSKRVNGARQVRTVCGYCGVGCNLDVATRGNEILAIRPTGDAAVNEGHSCVKGRFAFRFYNHPDRLRSPLIRRNGKFEEASWDEACDYIAERLSEIRKVHGPDSIGGISSARCTNEENYLMQKFIRAVIGTNNIDGCARVCHAPTAYGMQQAFGTGAATNSIADIEKTDLMLVTGANPTDAHPVTGAKLKQAAMKGTKLIVIDPRETELARYADYHLQVRPGANAALLNLLAYYILEDDLVDHDFVKDRCEQFEEYAVRLRKLDPEAMSKIAGVDSQLVKSTAEEFANAPRAMMFHGLGVTEHSQGSKSIMLLCNLAMMTGNIGREGVGVNPLRGQNNVQGAADMGVQPHQGPGYLDMSEPGNREHYARIWDCEVSGVAGLKIPEMFEAAKDGQLRALWVMGENMMQTDPNIENVRQALTSLNFLVVQELFMTETAEIADVVLPGASFLEKNGTFTNGERRVQRVNQAVEPLEGTKPDGQGVIEVMKRMGYAQADYDPAIVLEEISQAVPFFAGIRWDNLGENGKQWPVSEDGQDTQILHQTEFKRGKGKFHYFDFEETEEIERNIGQYPYILTTGRILAHYNAGTMTRRTGNVDICPEDLLSIHPTDAQREKIGDGDSVKVASARGEVVLKATVTDEVKPGTLHATFHFPDLELNLLTSEVMDAESKCPEYKVTAVRIAPAVI